MKRRTLLILVALMAAFALMLTGCGSKEPAETTAPQAVADDTLGLASWEMSATTWSSPNGATVHVSAIPSSHADGQYAVFTVRLEGDDIQNIPCDWDGTRYTASADLNAADGYCYYVTLTTVAGEQAEIAVNTPAAPVDETLTNMESALNSYCHLLVESSDADDKKLTIIAGIAQIQPPQIANNGEAVVCSEAALVLSHNGQEVDRKILTLSAPEVGGVYTVNIADIRFDIPAMEDDQELTLRLDVVLSNGQTLTDTNGTWFFNDGQLVSAVG
jgi:hypothetical protein